MWLPPGYATSPERRYPVVYFHDGQNVFDAATSFLGIEWGADEAAGRMVRDGKLAPCILVAVANSPERIAEYTPVADPGRGGGRAADYARFLQMLLNGGTLDGKRYLSPQTVRYMTTDHMGSVIKPGPLYLPGAGYGFGLGFAVRLSDGVAPYAGSAGDYYWGGAGGTYFWVDPRQEMFVVFMMQSPKQRVYYRSLIRDMTYAALVK